MLMEIITFSVIIVITLHNIPAKDWKQKWKTRRDEYKRHKKEDKAEKKSGAGAAPPKRKGIRAFDDYLTFLDNHLQDRW